MVYYFAYGSNMSKEQMKKRLGKVVIGEKGVLKGFELVFNKQADKKPGVSYSNIINKEGSEVQGAIYKISEKELAVIDRREGYPDHYKRIELNIVKEDGTEVPCIIYIANSIKIGSGLKPERDYLEKILAGKKFITDDYYEKLQKVETYD